MLNQVFLGQLLAASRRRQLARQTGERAVGLVADNVRPRDIVTSESIHNAFTVDMALGGSTNSVLHIMAVAQEAGIDLPLESINRLNETTPTLCKLSPAGEDRIEDLDRAGGIQALMKVVADRLDVTAPTASGKTVVENLTDVQVLDDEVIRSVDNAHAATGGIAILFGNLAPEGAIVKKSAVAPEMVAHQGPARVFDSEEDATVAIMNDRIRAGDVVVIRNEGPRGGPGMREMLTPTSLLSGMGMDKDVALITDGRFSGGPRGAAIGHVSPEAAARGPIAAIAEGDTIKIDIANYRLEVELGDDEIAGRLASLPEFEPRITSGYLRRYIDKVSSASTGAVFS